MGAAMKKKLVFYHASMDSTGRDWRLTLADLFSLLLAFFVMIYAMADTPVPEWEKIRSSLNHSHHEIHKEALVEGEGMLNLAPPPLAGLDVSYLYRLLQVQLREMPVVLTSTHDRLVISLSSDVFFATGTSTLTAKATPNLDVISHMLARLPNVIAIEGHTDPRANKDGTNWALSLARAAAVADILRSNGVVSPLRIYGRADGDFASISEDLDLQERYKRARRVDIIIHAQ
jgi:chemotaxis protein MotB